MSRLVLSVVLLLGAAFAVSPRAAEEPEGLAWCYRSLADVVCYIAPDPGREDRFVGAYPFRPDAAQRLLIEESRRRAAALAPRRWPPVSPREARAAVPAPAAVPAAPGPPAQPATKHRGERRTPAKTKAAAHPPPLPVPRPPVRHAAVDRSAAAEASPPRASPAPPSPSCGAARAGRPRPLLEAGSGCNAESD